MRGLPARVANPVGKSEQEALVEWTDRLFAMGPTVHRICIRSPGYKCDIGYMKTGDFKHHVLFTNVHDGVGLLYLLSKILRLIPEVRVPDLRYQIISLGIPVYGNPLPSNTFLWGDVAMSERLHKLGIILDKDGSHGIGFDHAELIRKATLFRNRGDLGADSYEEICKEILVVRMRRAGHVRTRREYIDEEWYGEVQYHGPLLIPKSIKVFKRT